MKASKTQNRFQTGYHQPKSGFQTNGINIHSPNINVILTNILS